MHFLIFYSCASYQNAFSEGLQGDCDLLAGGTGKSQPFVHFESSQVTDERSLQPFCSCCSADQYLMITGIAQ